MVYSVEDCEEQEWLIPNGLGGYASSTKCGINSRTYHGLLVVPQQAPRRRYVVLAKVEDSILSGGKEVWLSSNRYTGAVYPKGHTLLEKFEWSGNFVRWDYSLPVGKVRKTLQVHEGFNAITISYDTGAENSVKVCPLITFRSHHTVKRSGFGHFNYSKGERNIAVFVNYEPMLYLSVDKEFELLDTGYWYYNFEYRLDKERGSNYIDDLYNPFCIVGKGLTITFFTEPYQASPLRESPRDPIQRLKNASLSFVVKGQNGYGIIAGYHWFGEWGRDTLISLEGILLQNELFPQAKVILERYLINSSKGLMPNFFDEAGNPFYSAVDVSLWWFMAAYKYFLYTQDIQFVFDNLEYMEDVMEWYYKGNGIVGRDKELIYHRGAPLTWMDASYDGNVVTPREGFAVEVNALWYNAMMVYDYFLKKAGEKSEWAGRAEKMRWSFNENFVNEWGLYDLIYDDLRPDSSIRPNMLFAVSLPFPIVDRTIASTVVDTVERYLLRPFGVSTLARTDPRYRPYYRGDRRERDEAYHNGPIWPWLIGAYVDAKLSVIDSSIGSSKLMQTLDPLVKLSYTSNGYLPELFDDVPPYKMGGCIAQAWSVAEVLRSLSRLSSS